MIWEGEEKCSAKLHFGEHFSSKYQRRWMHSESHDGTEGDPQVVVRSVIEVHLVSRLKTESNRAEARLDSACWVKDSVHARSTQPQNRTHDAAVRKQAPAQPEINESRLQRGKGTKMTKGTLHHRADETMCYSDRRILDGHDISIRDINVRFMKVQAVVIGQLALEHHGCVNAISEARAEPYVGSSGLRDAERVEKNPRLHPRLGNRDTWKDERQEE